MKKLSILMLLILGGTAWAGGTISFRQDGLPVTSIAASDDPDFFFLGTVPVKSGWVDFCVKLTDTIDHCIPLLTDKNGFYAGYSPQDPSGCQFEISSVDFETCDYTARTLEFSVQRQDTHRVMATGNLVIE